MEWLGAMFKGIGDTFMAGSQAHQALIGERNLKRQLAFDKEALAVSGEQGMLAWLMQKRSQETTLVIVIITGIIVMLAVMLIFRRKK